MNKLLAAISQRLNHKAINSVALDNKFKTLLLTATPTVAPVITDSPLAFFKQQAQQNLFDYHDCSQPEDIISAINNHALPAVFSGQPSLTKIINTNNKASVNYQQQPSLGVVQASAGIAETGTVVFHSDSVCSSFLFLAEELLVVLKTCDVVTFQEDYWQTVDAKNNRRAIHWVSGPSRTADIEQTIQVGAHGPRRVHLWVLAD